MKYKCVKDVMQTKVITADTGLSVQELAHLLTDNRISGAPVVDAQGHLVGVVSLSDLAVAATRATGEVHVHKARLSRYWDHGGLGEDIGDGFSVQDFDGSTETVESIMTPAVYRIQPKATLLELADLLLKSQIHRVVVTEGEKLVGIVTTTDLVREYRDLLREAALA